MPKHYCPMCGEQWDDSFCLTCGWHEGKRPKYTGDPRRRPRKRATLGETPADRKEPTS